MSTETYNRLWAEAMQDLLMQVHREYAPLASYSTPKESASSSACFGFTHFAELYIHYILVCNKLEECHNFMVHPHKRRCLKKMLQWALVRLLEVKSQLAFFSDATNRNSNGLGNGIRYNSNTNDKIIVSSRQLYSEAIAETLLHLKVSPSDALLHVPRFMVEDQENADAIEVKRNKIKYWLNIFENKEKSSETSASSSNTTTITTTTTDHNIDNNNNNHIKKKTFLRYPMTLMEAVKIIRRNERGRAGIYRTRLLATWKKRYQCKSMVVAIPSKKQMQQEEEETLRQMSAAVTCISSNWRGFVERRKFAQRREEELVFLRMLPSPTLSSSLRPFFSSFKISGNTTTTALATTKLPRNDLHLPDSPISGFDPLTSSSLSNASSKDAWVTFLSSFSFLCNSTRNMSIPSAENFITLAENLQTQKHKSQIQAERKYEASLATELEELRIHEGPQIREKYVNERRDWLLDFRRDFGYFPKNIESFYATNGEGNGELQNNMNLNNPANKKISEKDNQNKKTNISRPASRLNSVGRNRSAAAKMLEDSVEQRVGPSETVQKFMMAVSEYNRTWGMKGEAEEVIEYYGLSSPDAAVSPVLAQNSTRRNYSTVKPAMKTCAIDDEDRPDAELTRAVVRPIVEAAEKTIADETIRNELENLKQMYEKGKATSMKKRKRKKSKKKGVGKKKSKGKKSQGDKTKRRRCCEMSNPYENADDIFADLVKDGLLKEIEKPCRLTDFYGEFQYEFSANATTNSATGSYENDNNGNVNDMRKPLNNYNTSDFNSKLPATPSTSASRSHGRPPPPPPSSSSSSVLSSCIPSWPSSSSLPPPHSHDALSIPQIRQLILERVILPLDVNLTCPSSSAVSLVLLFGPSGSGKTKMAKTIAWESGAMFFDLSPSTIQSTDTTDTQSGGAVRAFVHKTFEAAKRFAPSVIYIDEVDKVFNRRRARSGRTTDKDREETTDLWNAKQYLRFQKELINHVKHLRKEEKQVDLLQMTTSSKQGNAIINNNVSNEEDHHDKHRRHQHPIVIVGCTSKPFRKSVDQEKMLSFFKETIWMSFPDYSSRLLLWRQFMNANGVRGEEALLPLALIKTLSKISEGYSAGSIERCVQHVLTACRVQQIEEQPRPLKVEEFSGPLSRSAYCWAEEWLQFREFDITASGERERMSRLLQIQEEEKLEEEAKEKRKKLLQRRKK